MHIQFCSSTVASTKDRDVPEKRDNELEAIRSRLERSEMVENWAIINDEL